MFRHVYILLILLTLAGAGRSELVLLGDWPGDGTRTALETDGQLIRNAGRILERWDLATEPPTLLDSLILPSPPIDLLDWDGILLVLRDDGVLEARHLEDGWDPPLWTLELSTCATELLRHGRWLLPVSPFMPLLDLVDPMSPVVAQDPLGWGGDGPGNFGGFHACFVGDTLIGDYNDCCGPCWDVIMGACWMTLDESGPVLPSEWVPNEGDWWPWDWDSPIVAADHLGLVLSYSTLSCFDLADWSLRQSITLPDSPGEVCLAARDSLVMVSSSNGSTLYHAAQAQEPPLQVLDSIAVPDVRQLRLEDGHALAISDGETGWIDLAEPENLVLSASLPAQGSITGVGRSGGGLLVRQRDLRVFEPQDGSLVPSAALALPPGEGLAVSGSLALAGTEAGLLVIDLTDPDLPTVVTEIPAPGIERFCLEGIRAAYVASGELVVLSLEDPGQPQERLRQPVGEVSDLAIGGGIVACAEYLESIQLIDARDLEHVAVVWTLDWLGAWGQERVAFCGDRLAIAWGESLPTHLDTHLDTYDLVDPASPQLEESRLWSWYDLVGLEGGVDRLVIGVHLQPIWGSATNYHLFDVVEGSGLAPTAHWDIQIDDATPDYALLEGGWLVRHFEDSGVDLQLDDSIISVEPPAGVQPDAISLAAAPNPFNPRAWLDLTLARPGPARLAVYDLLGREVAVLCDGPQPAGAQRVVFEGAGLASGLYLARLEAEGGSRTVKLALVK